MPDIDVRVAHEKTVDEAKQCVANTVVSLYDTYQGFLSDSSLQWDGPVATFTLSGSGMRIVGTVEVSERDIRVTVQKLPLVAKMLKGQIEETIRTEAQKALNG